MLRKNNTLRHLYCDMNQIYLQGFSAIVNSLEQNTSLLYLPVMDWDRLEQVKAVKEQLKCNTTVTKVANTPPPPQQTKTSYLHRKSVNWAGVKKGEKKSLISDQLRGPHAARAIRKPAMGRQLSTVGEEQVGTNVGGFAGMDSNDLLEVLEDRWEAEIKRSVSLLERNVTLAEGLGNTVGGLLYRNGPVQITT